MLGQKLPSKEVVLEPSSKPSELAYTLYIAAPVMSNLLLNYHVFNVDANNFVTPAAALLILGLW